MPLKGISPCLPMSSMLIRTFPSGKYIARHRVGTSKGTILKDWAILSVPPLWLWRFTNCPSFSWRRAMSFGLMNTALRPLLIPR